MYTKDKQTRLTLRLNTEQFNFVKQSADLLGTSPSDFLRMVINMTMASVKKTSSNPEYQEAIQKQSDIIEEAGKEALKEIKEGNRRENETADIVNQL